jgi:hypothetical protein
MSRLLVGNVVSSAYFEAPETLADDLHTRGDHLGYRMLWLARPDDTTLLGSRPSDAFRAAVAGILGFAPRILVTERRGRETVPEAAARLVSSIRRLAHRAVVPYAHSMDVYELATAIGCSVSGPDRSFVERGLIRSANSKCTIRRIAPHLSIPLPDGEVRPAADSGDPAWRNGSAVMVKERLSGGGLGNSVIPWGAPTLAVDLAHPFVVERFEDFRSWPSVDFVIDSHGRVRLRQLSLMRVTQNAYDGVVIPPDGEPPGILAEVIRCARALGRWWARRGYRGWYDVDAGVTRSGRVLVTEMNARCTGGTPIDAIARRLAGPRYERVATILAREHLAAARPADAIASALEMGLVASRERPVGVVPLWEAPDEQALGYMVLGSSRAEAESLERRFVALASS